MNSADISQYLSFIAKVGHLNDVNVDSNTWVYNVVVKCVPQSRMHSRAGTCAIIRYIMYKSLLGFSLHSTSTYIILLTTSMQAASYTII